MFSEICNYRDRGNYVLPSCKHVVLQVVAVFWRSTPNYYWWRCDNTLLIYVMVLVHCLAWVMILSSIFHLDHLELFGIKQVCIDNVCVYRYVQNLCMQ